MNAPRPDTRHGTGWRVANVCLVISLLAVAFGVLAECFVLDRGCHSCNHKTIPFKCTSCGKVRYFSLQDLMDMGIPAGPSGPLVLACPKCKNKTLTQAVKCLVCKEVFIMKYDQKTGTYIDLCPACGKSYAQAWKEKYRPAKSAPAGK